MPLPSTRVTTAKTPRERGRMSPMAASRELRARAPRRAKCFALAALAGGKSAEIVTSVMVAGVTGIMVRGGWAADRQGVSKAIGGEAADCRKCSVI